MTRYALGTLDDFVDGAARQVRVGDTLLAVARIGDDVFAIADRCSHAEFSLSEGDVDVATCQIECARHGAMFSLRTGDALTFPATKSVATYEVISHGGTLEVELP